MPAGALVSEKYINPDITKVSVTVNGSPIKIYNNGIDAKNLWLEISLYFQPKEVPSKIDLIRFYADKKLRLFIDLRSMADTKMHGSGVRLVNTTDSVFLKIYRKVSGSGNVKCNVFIISVSQMNIMEKQLQSVQF